MLEEDLTEFASEEAEEEEEEEQTPGVYECPGLCIRSERL